MVQLRSTERTAQVNPVMVLSPALWIFVVLATLGSILTLALWFIIYRRQNSLSSTSGKDNDHQMICFISCNFIQFYELIPHMREQHSPGSSAAESATSWVRSFQSLFCSHKSVISWEKTDHLCHKNNDLSSMSRIKCPCM